MASVYLVIYWLFFFVWSGWFLTIDFVAFFFPLSAVWRYQPLHNAVAWGASQGPSATDFMIVRTMCQPDMCQRLIVKVNRPCAPWYEVHDSIRRFAPMVHRRGPAGRRRLFCDDCCAHFPIMSTCLRIACMYLYSGSLSIYCYLRTPGRIDFKCNFKVHFNHPVIYTLLHRGHAQRLWMRWEKSSFSVPRSICYLKQHEQAKLFAFVANSNTPSQY